MGYIYLRKNLTNGKCYVGQTVDIERRNRNWNSLKERYGGYVINNARKKYGTDGFSFELLKECPNEDMNFWEMYYIKMYNSKKPYGYNSTDGGDSTYEMTEVTKKKISATKRGTKHSDEARKKIGDANRGKKLSEETKAKLSAARRGKKLSEEHKRKISITLKGKKRPDISAALRGRKRPDIADALKGKKLSEETKAKLSAVLRGRKRPAEVVEKIANAQRGKTKPKTAAALSKPVQALDKNGNVVYEFASTMEAQRHGFHQGNVAACCRGERKTAYGFIWRYAEK